MMRTATRGADGQRQLARCPGRTSTQPTKVASGGEQDGGHEPGGDLVGESLHGGLGALGVLDEPDDLGQGAVGADGGGANDEGAGAVEVAPMTGSPAALSTGRLSPVSIDSSTVEAPSTTIPSTGTFSPGRTRTRSPTATCSTGTSTSSAVADDAGGLGCEADEGLDGGGGRASWPRLQPAAHQDQGDDDQRGLEVQVQRQAPALGLAGPQGDEGAVAVGDAGAERDQGVHVGGRGASRPAHALA